MLFSLSFAIYLENQAFIILNQIGLYEGLLEFFSGAGIKLTLLFIIFLLFFMMFSAIKLMADTILQISLLFFSNELDGESLKSARLASIVFLVGGSLSILCTFSILAIALVFFITIMLAFTYIVYKASAYLSTSGLIGFVFFQTFVWGCLITAIAYVVLKFYNSLLASLPI